jgi:Mrp family chromosome partitioning ATPase
MTTMRRRTARQTAQDQGVFAEPRALRLALALGDQELEQRLRPTLEASDSIEVAAQCLAADQVLEAAQARRVDVVLVAWGLHRLTDNVLVQLERTRLPLLVLAPDPDAARWSDRHAVVLPLHVDAATLRETIQATARGDRPQPSPVAAHSESTPSRPRGSVDPDEVSVIAVAGSARSPGRTTVALNLATALGAAEATVLVDADFASPSVAAYLDCDPSRNVCTLAHAVRESPHVWSRVLDDELQPLHERSRAGRVLCGLPKREMRSSVSPAALERIIGELSQRFRYVVLDVGTELIGIEAVPTLHRAAVQSAHHVLVVTAPDLVGLWHARTSLGQLEQQVEIGHEMMSLVINRHDPKHHHTRQEIEWHLGYPASAVVPHDFAGMQRAMCEQRPAVVDPRSRSGRALIGLAECVHQGRIQLPSARGDTDPQPNSAWSRLRNAAHAASARLRPTTGHTRSPSLTADRGRGGAW